MSVNKIYVKGLVGRIETHNEEAGPEKRFVTMSVNCSEYMGKDPETNENRYENTWFEAIAFGGQATRLLSARIAKGDYVELEGRMTMRENERDGRKYQNWSINLREFELLRRATTDSAGSAPAVPAAKKAAPKKAAKPAPEPVAATDDWDDEIPF